MNLRLVKMTKKNFVKKDITSTVKFCVLLKSDIILPLFVL